MGPRNSCATAPFRRSSRWPTRTSSGRARGSATRGASTCTTTPPTLRALPTAGGGSSRTGSIRRRASATRCRTGLIVRTALAKEFHKAPVERLDRFFRDFRSSLAELAPERRWGEDPQAVFLTPGPANETYFEHAYLARFLGQPLVEGADLTTRDRQVFLRTVGGLKRVDTIVRRVDSGFCDPLELNSQSVLGVPGLVHAAHGGRVAIANQLGGAALESSCLLAFLKPLCRAVLGEDLRLPSVATWWCGQQSARKYVLENLENLVIKPSFRVRGAFATRYGALLSEHERRALAASIEARPGRLLRTGACAPRHDARMVRGRVEAGPVCHAPVRRMARRRLPRDARGPHPLRHDGSGCHCLPAARKCDEGHMGARRKGLERHAAGRSRRFNHRLPAPRKHAEQPCGQSLLARALPRADCADDSPPGSPGSASEE